jgi:hypothetical protein
VKQQAKQKTYQPSGNNFVSFSVALRFVLLIGLFNLCGVSPFAQNDLSTAANLSEPPAKTDTAAKQSSETPKSAPAPPAETLIHLGDTIEIDVLGSLDYDWRGKADDEGNLTALHQLNTAIPTLCRTEGEIAADVVAAYSKFIRDPQVVVRVLDRTARQPAVVFGAVRTQQRFRIQRAVRLNEIVVLSGGITDSASGEVKIVRPAFYSCLAHNQSQPQTEYITVKLADLMAGKADANPFVRTGDVVTVEEAAPVYVMGGVAAPQRILFRQGLSLSRAIASAGGLSRGGDAAKITIFRRQSNSAQTEIIEADLEQIERKKAADIVLQPFDIVEVSQSGRERNRRPPVINSKELTQVALEKLPLRVVS